MTAISPLPFTERFFAVQSENDRLFHIWYRGDLNRSARLFGYSWNVQGWGIQYDGDWTFNRSDVAIENKWWPAIYQHDTLTDLLNHLEETFVEGVPANRPKGY